VLREQGLQSESSPARQDKAKDEKERFLSLCEFNKNVLEETQYCSGAVRALELRMEACRERQLLQN
jgi:hypothetical protein